MAADPLIQAPTKIGTFLRASEMLVPISRHRSTVRHRGMGTGISESSKRVPIFKVSFDISL